MRNIFKTDSYEQHSKSIILLLLYFKVLFLTVDFKSILQICFFFPLTFYRSLIELTACDYSNTDMSVTSFILTWLSILCGIFPLGFGRHQCLSVPSGCSAVVSHTVQSRDHLHIKACGRGSVYSLLSVNCCMCVLAECKCQQKQSLLSVLSLMLHS